jgi:hypothetical protein
MSHPMGYFQPGVLALTSDGRVLYRWRSRPTRRNVGGAIARPTEDHVWKCVRAALEQPAGAPHAPHDDDPVLSDPPVPWAVFILLLLANGWFLRPVVFDQRSGADTVPRRQRNAALRIPIFFAAWIAAFVLLPVWLVALALAAWMALVAPGIRTLSRNFQNVGPDEEPA